VDQILEALAFGVEDTAAERRETVVAAARVVELGRGTGAGFRDEVSFDEALERAVEGGGPQADLAGGALENFLHDAVAVLLFAGEGEQDMEPLRLEREERLDLGLFGMANMYIA
jgi:hypothetical protein